MKVTPPLQPRWGLPLAALSLLLLSACGGGSGGGGLVQNQNNINSGGEISAQDMFNCETRPSPEPCAQPPAQNQGDDDADGGSLFINQDTAASVTKAVIGIIEELYGFGGLDGAAANMLTGISASSSPSRLPLLQFLKKQLHIIAELDQQGLLHTPSVVGVRMVPVVNCKSGSASSEPSGNGEGIDINFDNCEIEGNTLNGDITLSDIQHNGDTGNPAGTWDLAADFAFRGFNISSADETVSYSGALRFTLASNDGNIEGHLIVTSPLGISVAGLQNDFLRNNFTLEYAYDASTNETVLAVGGTLQRGTSENNILAISTPEEPLTLNPNVDGINVNGQQQGPYSGGRLRIVSNNQTSVVLDVQGNLSVILIINDSDPGLSLSWEELLAR